MLFLASLLRAQLVRQLPQPVNFRENLALEIEGFDEFETGLTDVSDISPRKDSPTRAEHRKEIEELAVKIIKSNGIGNDPIFGVRVEGHADIAKRGAPISASARKQIEDQISAERGVGGLNELLNAVMRRSGNDLAIVAKIARNSKSVGLGTRQLKEKNATNDTQFKRNRRVVFIARQATLVPPPREAPPSPSSTIEDRFEVRLVNAGNFTVTIGAVAQSFSLSGVLEITDKVEKKKARFDVLATGGGVASSPTKLGGSVTFAPGPLVPFKTFRLLSGPGGRGVAPLINLNSFEGDVTVFVDASASKGGTQSDGGTLSFSFDALAKAGANTIPSIVRIPSGNGSVNTPGASSPQVLPFGLMRMAGAPSKL